VRTGKEIQEGNEAEKGTPLSGQHQQKASTAPRMHLQMRVLAQSININKPATAGAGFQLFALFRTTISTRLPNRLNHGDQIFS
jgi:hypothetical protein